MGSVSKTQPAVAVIIPVKNRADLLKATLENLLAQTLAPAEICVVDDHSTDHLPEILARFPQVIFLKNIGQGPGAARNAGLAATKSHFVQYFDSDDLLTCAKLEKQAEALISTGADIAYGPYVKAQEAEPGTWLQTDVIMQASPLPSAYLQKWILQGWNALTQSMMFRRSFIERLPPWDSTLITHEDYLYMARAASQLPTIVHVPEQAVLYRQHGQQSTGDNIRQRAKAIDAYRVLQLINQETNWAEQDYLTRLLFNGRLYQNERYALSLQALEGSEIHQNKRNEALLYKIYNKFERFLTKTDWERMHGASTNPADYARIIDQLPPCSA